MKTLGDSLREERKKKFRFAREFAEVLGIEPPAYRRYERGEVEPDIELLVRMCDMLGISSSRLVPTKVDLAQHSLAAQKTPEKSHEHQKRGSEPKAAA